MASKALVVLGFLLVALVLISSEVAARELAEEAKEVQTKEPVNDVQQGYGGGYPGGGGGYPGGGYPGRGGGYPGGGGGYPGGGNPGRGGGGYGCRYGCCGRGYHRCKYCCSYEGEVPDFHAEAEPHN